MKNVLNNTKIVTQILASNIFTMVIMSRYDIDNVNYKIFKRELRLSRKLSQKFQSSQNNTFVLSHKIIFVRFNVCICINKGKQLGDFS